MSKKLRILLLCAGGASTSFLIQKIKEAAKEKGINLDIVSSSVAIIDYVDWSTKPFDVILVAPQVRFSKKHIEEKVQKYGIAVFLIDYKAYGLFNGKKILEQTLEKI
ncbi:MAG: PTS sugar transporter subunit IIB [Candidatus Njordarchaeales archaeon]